MNVFLCIGKGRLSMMLRFFPISAQVHCRETSHFTYKKTEITFMEEGGLEALEHLPGLLSEPITAVRFWKNTLEWEEMVLNIY